VHDPARADPVVVTADAVRPAVALAQPTEADRVLALQRTVGNRAVARMIAASAPRVELAREPTTVSEYVKEETDTAENVTWTASFDVNFDESTKTCWATTKIQLVPDGGISDEDVEWTKIGVLSRFSLLWDSRYSFHEHRSILADRDWLFRPGIEFVNSGAHEIVHLHPGKGASKRAQWYLMKGEINQADPSKSVPQGYAEVEHAHEVSHQMGLLDEYEDIHVAKRKTYSDHSLMGDYANEGYDKVRLQPRHGERMAAIIGRATDRNLTSRMVRGDDDS
jgi:hypothetical protein